MPNKMVKTIVLTFRNIKKKILEVFINSGFPSPPNTVLRDMVMVEIPQGPTYTCIIGMLEQVVLRLAHVRVQ